MRRNGLFAVLALAVACGGGVEARHIATARDSAGISIMENSGPAWTPGKEWQVQDSVLLDITGDVDSVFGPVRFTDGRLAIANAGTHEVRVYDGTGKPIHASGRAGSGPGEYQMLAGIWIGPGDSLLVSDFLVRRVSVLDRDANFVRAFSLGAATGGFVPLNGRIELAGPQGWFADGSVAAVTMSFAMNQAREGSFRDTVSALRYGADGSLRDTVARFPGMEMEQVTMTMGPQSFSAPSPVPLGRASVSAVNGDRFYLAQNNRWEVEVRRSDGTLARLIRVAAEPRPLTAADIAVHRKAQREMFEGMPALRMVPEAMKRQIMSRIEQAKYPATMSFISALMLDSEANLWVQEVTPPGEQAISYAVVDTTGTLLGRVRMPADFRATSVSGQAVFGIWKDPDDVQHIRAYPLRKGP